MARIPESEIERLEIVKILASSSPEEAERCFAVTARDFEVIRRRNRVRDSGGLAVRLLRFSDA